VFATISFFDVFVVWTTVKKMATMFFERGENLLQNVGKLEKPTFRKWLDT